MSKPSKPTEPKVAITSSAKTAEFETKFLAKSDWPKTSKESIKMVLNLIANFFPL